MQSQQHQPSHAHTYTHTAATTALSPPPSTAMSVPSSQPITDLPSTLCVLPLVLLLLSAEVIWRRLATRASS